MLKRVGLLGAVMVAVLTGPASMSAAPPPVLTWSPTTSDGTFDYGAVAPGESASTTFTLTNSGGTSSSALATTLSGSAAFAITSNGCKGTSLAPHRSCIVVVRYTPVAGVVTDTGALAAVGRKPNTSASLNLAGASVLPRQIYWANAGEDMIGRANADGTGINQNFIAGPSVVAQGMAVGGQYLYWANGAAGVGRANRDGTDVHAPFFSVAGGIYSLDVDSQHVYWGHTDPNPALTGIGRADLNGGSQVPMFITGTTDPFDVAVDATHIYWADCGANAIGRADLDGLNVDHAFITAASCPIGVAVDAGHIYWTNFQTNTIGRADIDGQNANSAFITGTAGPFGLTVDSAFVYWTNQISGSLGRADLSGSNVNQAFIPATVPRGVAVDPG